MKTILFTFAYDDFRAREVLSSARGKLEHFGYEALSPLDLKPGEDWAHSTTDLLKRASAVIAFVTERSPNVLFETGYAYGLGKNLILVSDMSTLPFDLRTVAAIDARSSPAEISFEIVRQVNRFESSGWQPETALPNNLREMLEASVHRPELFELVDREAFERAIVTEFATQGFAVDFPQGSQESGFDMRLRDISHRSMLVEVKKLNPNSKVSISSVQQLLGATHAYEDSAALLICTSDFTNSAREFALRQSSRITLWSLAELKRFVEHRITAPQIEALLAAAK